MNRKKTSLFSSVVNSDCLDSIRSILDFSIDTLPVKYLRVPFLSSRLSCFDCQPLLANIKSRVHAWKAGSLTYLGRMILIKYILTGMVYFWLSQFVLPKRAIKELTSSF